MSEQLRTQFVRLCDFFWLSGKYITLVFYEMMIQVQENKHNRTGSFFMENTQCFTENLRAVLEIPEWKNSGEFLVWLMLQVSLKIYVLFIIIILVLLL